MSQQSGLIVPIFPAASASTYMSDRIHTDLVCCDPGAWKFSCPCQSIIGNAADSQPGIVTSQ